MRRVTNKLGNSFQCLVEEDYHHGFMIIYKMFVGILQAVTPRHQPTVFITHSICIYIYIFQILNWCETWETQLIAAYQGDSQKGRIAVLGETSFGTLDLNLEMAGGFTFPNSHPNNTFQSVRYKLSCVCKDKLNRFCFLLVASATSFNQEHWWLGAHHPPNRLAKTKICLIPIL